MREGPSSSVDKLIIKGARQHNLKKIDVEIPRNAFVVITGISGSGKSSLAFDTIYAEGQRRYIESLSAYARQFLGQMDKPDVEYIDGLSPAIAIQQRSASRNPRSTVATVTEIHDHLRLLFARIGKPHCWQCGRPIDRQTVEQIVDRIIQLEGKSVRILAPVARGQKGEFQSTFDDLKSKGFVRVQVDGMVYELGSEKIKLAKNKKHTIHVLVDRLTVEPGIRNRLADSVQTAVDLSSGVVMVDVVPGGRGRPAEPLIFSEWLACPECGLSLEELEPRMFSFNNPFGACRECSGLGTKLDIDPDLIIPDKTKSLREGAMATRTTSIEDGWAITHYEALAKHYGFSIDTPIKDLDPKIVHVLLYGSGDEKIKFSYRNEKRKLLVEYEHSSEGTVNAIARRFRQTKSQQMRDWYQRFMSERPCPACHGERLRPESLAVTIKGRNIAHITKMSIAEASKFIDGLELTDREKLISRQVLKEVKERLRFMLDVGLDYLTLDRTASSLSGGESQRIQLATQIGSRLVGVLYILDEPSIGLHARDNKRLIATLERLRDIGNTVLVVEHDEETMRSADWIVDLGPGAGVHGGRVVASGPIEEIERSQTSITGQYLTGKKRIPIPTDRRKGNGKHLIIIGARENNLKDIDVGIPLGTFTCITGVSGSGKSTLVDEILHKTLARALHGAQAKPGAHDGIKGIENVDKVVIIDQSPIGRTPRSNPATYTGLFGPIRDLFVRLPEAKVRGYRSGRFSFNVKGGRCEACAGHGTIRLEMHFLPDVWVPCDLCKGKRFNRETLEIKYRGKNIAEVLEMTVEEALEFFRNIPPIKNILQTLYDVGLGYIELGQPATTISGGEAQRVKLSTELSRRATGRTIYILDEPTTGLHFDDIRKLLDVLDRLTDAGNTVVVIEHNLDVVKTADHIIDLGPGGGDEGGHIVAEGTPEQLTKISRSFTGQALKRVLGKERRLTI
jgi:excinuclease ABC subunit A